MKHPIIVLFLVLICSSSIFSRTAVTIENLPPVVVHTVPQSGSINIEPETSEIRITFSKEMMTDKMWSFVMIDQGSFPSEIKDIAFLNDKRTCVAKVRLEPGKTYAIWLNSSKFTGFRDINNNPAVPYLLVFKTKDK